MCISHSKNAKSNFILQNRAELLMLFLNSKCNTSDPTHLEQELESELLNIACFTLLGLYMLQQISDFIQLLEVEHNCRPRILGLTQPSRR
jgi:hypothetical protein